MTRIFLISVFYIFSIQATLIIREKVDDDSNDLETGAWISIKKKLVRDVFVEGIPEIDQMKKTLSLGYNDEPPKTISTFWVPESLIQLYALDYMYEVLYINIV